MGLALRWFLSATTVVLLLVATPPLIVRQSVPLPAAVLIAADDHQDRITWRYYDQDGPDDREEPGAHGVSQPGEKTEADDGTGGTSCEDGRAGSGSVGRGEGAAAVEELDSQVACGDGQSGWLALMAISGTTVFAGAAYWLTTKLDPRSDLSAAAHADSDRADRPPPRATVVRASRDQQCGAGWRWRRWPEGRRTA